MNKQIVPDVALNKIPSGYLNIMGYVDESKVNGPGCRAVVWVQGCLRECPGCFNQASWSFEQNRFAQSPPKIFDLGGVSETNK
jgi:anaerobic ribonucleoside-triphosphate reductase activating protein